MSTIQVTQASQSIYPDGLQAPFIIRNLGPYTVYLDSDSSISEQSSYPLQPTATIAWDAGNPLWVRGASNMGVAGSSQLVITKNSQTADFNNTLTSVLFKDKGVISGGTPYVGPLIEATAWSSLVLRIVGTVLGSGSQPDATPANKNANFGFIQWLDESLNVIDSETFTCPPASAMGASDPIASNSISISFTVKAKYFRVTSLQLGSDVPIGQFDIIVIGVTNPTPNTMKWTADNGIKIHSSPGVLIAIPSDPEQGSDGIAFNIGASGWPSLYFSSIGRVLRGSVRCNAAVTTAGKVQFRSAFDSTIVHGDNVAIPVGAVGDTAVTFKVNIPIYTPTMILFTSPQQAVGVNVASATMKLWWSDD